MSNPQQNGDADNLMDHCYDGIQEYDNPLPGWWKTIFVGSMIFAVFYGIYYHLGGPGVSEIEAYQAEMKAHFEAQAKQGKGVEVSDEMVLMLAKSADTMATTKTLFIEKCAQCHENDGGGNIGPNLTDAYWIHGGKPVEIHKLIYDGVPAKGMLAWGKLLKPQQVINLAAYITTLKGTTPAKAKKPEGERVN